MSLSCPEAVFGLLRRAWSFKMEQEQGKEKGGNMTNIWFLLEFGHRFKASERIPGAFVCYPKTNTKAFPNIFYKLCDCNSPTKNPMSPGQEGYRPFSSETPGLPSLFCLVFPSSSGQPFVLPVPGAWCSFSRRGVQHSCFPLSSHLLRASGAYMSSLAWAFVPDAAGPGCVQPTCISV